MDSGEHDSIASGGSQALAEHSGNGHDPIATEALKRQDRYASVPDELKALRQ